MHLRLLSLCLIAALAAIATAAAPIADTPFVQEFAEKYPVEAGGPGDDVRDVAVTPDGRVLIATKAGVLRLEGTTWKRVAGGPDGPAYALHVDADGAVLAGAWDGIYRLGGDALQKEPGVNATISVLGKAQDGLIALGPDGFFTRGEKAWKPFAAPWSKSAREIALGGDGSLYIATQSGLYVDNAAGSHLVVKNEDITSTYVNAAATAPDGEVWIGCMGGIDRFEHGVRRAHYDTESGLTNYNVLSLDFDAEGRLWAGTALGVVRFDGKTWSLRHTRRWLPGDEVRGVAFDKEGTAWIATDKGVGAIKQRKMTLADKAAHYEAITRERHVRVPGLVEKCSLPNPEDFSKWEPVDDDNDGSYTAMYMAAQCLRYAATRDPEAKANADAAWQAVAFLHEITGGKGFVARTVVPAEWTKMHDMNETFTPQAAADERVSNPRFREVENRWRKSDDGKWWWKGDTSSDEVVGHFYAFNMYYHLAADETQKKQVRELCARLMDYLIEGNYSFIDPHTGLHTLWGMWTPERLNNDPEWRIEAPINCTEMLSFLLLTESITGDKKYRREFEKLFHDYKFGERLTRPKSYGRSERTHIDDDLLSMVWPSFILNDTDPRTQALWRQGCAWTYATIEHDVNPMFNFTYAWAGVEDTHNDESVEFLRDTPLDLRQFAVDSAKREDLKLRRFPMLEEWQTDRILPPSERGTMRWDKNPWAVFSGDFGDPEGRMEAAGTYWLLPYWMGRYLNIIGPPQP